ncbi:MAG: SAM-dependent methyltransferase [Candidatus Latescibacterota bacterium]
MMTHHTLRFGSAPSRPFLAGFLMLLVCLVPAAAGFGQQSSRPTVDDANQELKEIRDPDILFVPTPQEVVDKMLELVKVKKEDLVYDLGCGDGRIVVTAAKRFGCRGVGYDIDPQRVVESMENVRKNDVQHLVRIEQKDVFTLDLSQASVVTLYLLSSLNVKLIPQLEKLKPGTRIVSHDFDMQGIVTPDTTVTVESDGYSQHTVYMWTAPIKRNNSR